MGSAPRTLALASRVLPDCTPERAVVAAAHGGFDAVGVWATREWTDADTRVLSRRLADTGLRPIDVEVVRLRPGAADPWHERLLEIAAALGAPNVLVVSSDPDGGATIAKFAALCARARALGLCVSLEFGLFTEVKTLGAALEVIRAVDDPAARLLVDALHLARSGGTPDEVGRVPRERFAYAQLCDAPAVGPDLHDAEAVLAEAVDGRRLPGEGELPLAALLRALPDSLALSVEARSQALRTSYPDPDERAAVVARATHRFLAGVEPRA